MAEIREAFAMEQEQPQVPVLKECAVKQVDVTVPKTDDPDMPVLTFRMWFLGITTCVMLSFVNQFFWYRSEPLSVSSIAAQIAVVPVGHLMAKYITKRVFFQGSRLEFTLNPGPFNIKEHVLITIFANAGAGTVYATHILSAVKLLYKRPLGFLPAFLVMITTQFLGFGWAGIFRKYLVEPGEMWWPSNLVQVSLFRALHETEPRPKGGTSRTQFFVITLLCSFAYYIIPGYLFLMVGSISWVCWIAPKSVTVQQVGSGLQGLGLGSFALDWVGIASYLGSPLASPWFATANIAVGYVFIMYVVTPICYWFNVYNAKTFPIYSSKLFTLRGAKYPISEIVNSKFELDRKVYGELGPLNLSTFFAMSYGLGFAALSSTVVHIMLFHGSDMWNQTKKAFSGKNMDIHSWLMKKYNPVPGWWFHIILGVTIGTTIFTCEYYIETLQLPWWGVLLACVIAIFFTLPIGIIAATTNQAPGLNVITEYIIGYLYPERPVANILFKVYGYISMTQALTFVSDFKLGHYMKIPPKSMFLAQVIGTLISVLVYVLTAWWLMTTIPHLCDVSMLPENSPWKCPMDNVFYSASVIWGLVGPRRIFGDLGEYSNVNWFFLVGAIGPVLVFIAARAMPDVKWIRLIHIPLIFNATGMMPPASSINFNSWLVFAFLSGFVLYRYRFNWWQRYNYVLSGGLDAGTAFMTLLLFACLQSKDISLSWWGNDPEGCPLAKCPTAAGVFVEGCPAY